MNFLKSIAGLFKGKPSVSLIGPVEKIRERLVLRIPLAAGGRGLIECAKGISEVKDEALEIEIRDWLATKLEISEGSLVHVDNGGGKSNIWGVRKEEPNRPVQTNAGREPPASAESAARRG